MLLFKLQNFNATNSTLFGHKQLGIDNLIVSIKGEDNKRSRMARILQNEDDDLRRFNLNPDSPVVIVSSNISNALNSSDIKYILSFIRDPKPMLKSSDILIQSQIIYFKELDTKTNTLVAFPNNADDLKIEVPWTYVPFKGVKSSLEAKNCAVYKYNGTNWMISPNCKINNETDETKAVINCTSFDLVGVSCKQKQVFPWT